MPFDPESSIRIGLDAARAAAASAQPAPIEAATVDKEHLKTELRGVFESAVNKLEPRAQECENRVLLQDINSFDTRAKIDQAQRLLSEYSSLYNVESGVVDAKMQEIEGVLSPDEINQAVQDFVHRLTECSRIAQEADAYNGKLEEKKNHLPAESAPPAGDILPTPVMPPPRVETPRVINPANLEEARKAYVAAKKRLEDRNSAVGLVKKVFSKVLRKDTEQKIQDEYNKAKTAYEKARAEYIAADAERWEAKLDKFLAEKTALVEEQVRQVSKNALGEVYDKWKNLSSKWNLAKGLKIENRAGKLILGAVNARTMVSVGLLAGGVYFGAGAAVGAGMFAARRILSGASAAGGMYELANMAKSGVDRMRMAKNIDNVLDVNELENRMAALEARVILDGKKVEVLQTDELYKKLKEQLEKRYRAQFASLENGASPEQLYSFLELKSRQADEGLEKQIKSDKNYRRGAATGALAAGVLVGSGVPGRWLGSKMGNAWHRLFGGKNASATNMAEHPNTATPPPVEKFTPQKVELPKGAWAQTTPDGGLEIHAGQRGIEGALLDLKDADHAKYLKMLGWMNEQQGVHLDTPNVEADAGKIVHRFVDHFANTNNYSIGGGGDNDLNRMFAAGMKIGGDGKVNFDAEHFQFMKPLSGAVEQSDASGQLAKIQETARQAAALEFQNRGIGISTAADQPLYGGFTRPIPPDVGGVAPITETGSIGSGGGGSSVVESTRGFSGGGGGPVTPAETSVGSKSLGGGSAETVQAAPKLSPAQELDLKAKEILAQSQKDAVASRAYLNELADRTQAEHISTALQMHDLTQSLKLVYGHEYSHFFRWGHFKPSDLKKIQDLSLQDVLTKSAQDGKFGEKFKFIRGLITLRQQNSDLNMGMNLKEFLVKDSTIIKSILEGDVKYGQPTV